MQLLTQNANLRRHRIHAWTLPALGARLTDGSTHLTCPQAGACASLCYARAGTYQFTNVKAAHVEKLELVLNDPAGWQDAMLTELNKKKYRGAQVRVHDSGDFFAPWYAQLWLQIACAVPDVQFYAYTKEVSLFQHLHATAQVPANFHTIYSMGGKQDHLINRDTERHADVFPDLESLIAAGYSPQTEDDSLAYRSENHRIGIVANNIRHYRTRQGDKRFSEL